VVLHLGFHVNCVATSALRYFHCLCHGDKPKKIVWDQNRAARQVAMREL